MTGHTPGPWIVAQTGSRSYSIITASSSKDIAIMTTGSTKEDAREICANARLIAAAPDLLGVLQLALRYLEHPDVQAMQFALPVQAVSERAHAAIAKATGENK